MLVREAAKTTWVLTLALFCLSALGFAGSPSGTSAGKKLSPDGISQQIAVLKSGKPQQRAAAAYLLGQQHAAAASAVDGLVELLGDLSEVDPAKYRATKVFQKITLGEEVASALVNIGLPSIDPLIRVLKTSPDAEARKNAAWALGALHDSGGTTQI